MELSTLLNHTAPLAITYHGETINALVYTDRLTPLRMAKLVKALEEESGEPKDETALMLAELLASWGVTSNGEEFPPTYKNLTLVPSALLSHVSREVSSLLGERNKPSQS